MSFDGAMQGAQYLEAKKTRVKADALLEAMQALLVEQRRTNQLLEYHIAASGGRPPEPPVVLPAQRKKRWGR